MWAARSSAILVASTFLVVAFVAVIVLPSGNGPLVDHNEASPTSLSAQCTLSPKDTPTQVPRTLFGHNAINGPVFPIPYEDTALKEAAKMMWSGMLRYPGGTVANYWYWPNATYIDPCKGNGEFSSSEGNAASQAAGVAITSKTLDYDYCSKKATVDVLPAQTFTVTKFNEGYGSASPVRSTDGHMYDINVLTASPEEVKNQINGLDYQSKTAGFQEHTFSAPLVLIIPPCEVPA